MDTDTSNSKGLPATGDTVHLASPDDVQYVTTADFWMDLANAGIRTRLDFVEPNRWVAAVMWHQTASYPTQHLAMLAAVRWLINEVHMQTAAKEDIQKQQNWWTYFFS